MKRQLKMTSMASCIEAPTLDSCKKRKNEEDICLSELHQIQTAAALAKAIKKQKAHDKAKQEKLHRKAVEAAMMLGIQRHYAALREAAAAQEDQCQCLQ